MIGSPKLYECGQGVQCSCGSSSPAEKVGSNLTRAGLVQGMYMSGPCLASEAEVARKKVAQINDENLECPGNEELAIVKATLSYINTKNFCNTVCPLVVNGRQCNRKVGSNGHGWWHCDRCNQTFVNCDFKYMVLVQLQDSTGMIYAVVSQEAGKELFGCKAKELYSLKHEKRDHAQFDDIVQRVLFQQYLWKLKAETETFNDEQLAKWTIIKAEKVNPSTESHHLLRAIGMLLPEGSGSTSANQGMAAELPWKTVAEITDVLGCLVQPELFIVKATLSIINTGSFCYAACPLVVNGSQCGREAARNSDGWWHCNSCNQTFVTCDYRYRILAQLQDPTGNIYAFASQAGGEDIFSLSAKELYSMKYEKRDHAQFDNIVERVQFREYLFTVKLDKAEVVNPSTESHRLLSVINKLLLESSGSASVPRTSTGTRTVFSGLESQVQQRVHISSYAMNTGGARYLVSQSDSNSQ